MLKTSFTTVRVICTRYCLSVLTVECAVRKFVGFTDYSKMFTEYHSNVESMFATTVDDVVEGSLVFISRSTDNIRAFELNGTICNTSSGFT